VPSTKFPSKQSPCYYHYQVFAAYRSQYYQFFIINTYPLLNNTIIVAGCFAGSLRRGAF